VLAEDVRPAGGVEVGTPTGPRGGPPPAVTRIEPPRPAKGELVRVYAGVLDGAGGPFNAIDGAACSDDTALPADPCSAASPAVALQNATSPRGNRVHLVVGGASYEPDVVAVTPTILAFERPVDCWAPGTLVVTRGDDASQAVPLCDPGPCGGQPDGTACDDGDACTAGDVCAGEICGGTPVTCGACLACDSAVGCVPAPATGCRGSTRPLASDLTIRDRDDDTRDTLTWRWKHGAETTLADLGDPLATDAWELCLYGEADATRTLLLPSTVPPGGLCHGKPCWTVRGATGFRFADRDRTHGGLARLDLRSGTEGKATFTLQAKGPGLATPPTPLALPVRAQLRATTGACWESTFSLPGAVKNDAGNVKARSD
jgi:hypothetical protein